MTQGAGTIYRNLLNAHETPIISIDQSYSLAKVEEV